MSEIEREYPYQPGWLMIIACGLLFGVCAVWLGYIAATNRAGLSLFRVVTLAPGGATVFLWALSALSAGFVLIALALVWHRLTFKQRLALTAKGIAMPASRWSRNEQFIAFNDIQRLETLQVQGQRFLHIHHAGGKHTITASMLPSKTVFDEVCGIIAARVQT